MSNQIDSAVKKELVNDGLAKIMGSWMWTGDTWLTVESLIRQEIANELDELCFACLGECGDKVRLMRSFDERPKPFISNHTFTVNQARIISNATLQ